MNPKTGTQALKLAQSLLQCSAVKSTLTLCLMVFRACSNGAGLLLIVPLLQLIGIPLLHSGNTFLTQWSTRLFKGLHLPLNLLSVLCLFFLIQALIATAHLLEDLLRSQLHEQHQHQLQHRVYETLLKAKWAFLITQKNSDLLHHLTSQIQSTSMATFILLQLTSQLIILLTYYGLSLMISWPMTLMASLVALILLSLLLPLHRATARSGFQHLELSCSLIHILSEQLSALKFIKSSHTEAQFTEQLTRQSVILKQHTHHVTTIRSISKYAYSLGSALAFCMLLYLAIAQWHLPVETLLLLLVVFARMMPMMSALQQSYQLLLRHLPAFTALQDFSQACLAHQERTPALVDEPISFERHIEFKEVSFSYQPQARPVVMNTLSFIIHNNQTTLLTGRSGLGKSTIADLITGLLTPTKGSIYIDDQVLNPHNLAAWRQHIAYLTQDPLLLSFCT